MAAGIWFQIWGAAEEKAWRLKLVLVTCQSQRVKFSTVPMNVRWINGQHQWSIDGSIVYIPHNSKNVELLTDKVNSDVLTMLCVREWCEAVVSVLTGGVEVICRNLVDTNRRLINTSPSLVSSIMQYFGSARPDANNGRRSTSYSDSPTDTAILNFALLGQHDHVSCLVCELFVYWRLLLSLLIEMLQKF